MPLQREPLRVALEVLEALLHEPHLVGLVVDREVGAEAEARRLAARIRPQAAWNVRIQIERAVPPSRPSSRVRISPAALFVNVIARISWGLTPQASIRCATRYVSTRVLPEPAPATTSSGPSVASTASR